MKRYRNKYLLLLCLMPLIAINMYGQSKKNDYYLPKFALKTNALYWATTTPNLGIELALSKNMTLDISGNYNPFQFEDNMKLKHWLIQPELRLWTCERFNGHFFGLHGHYAKFNAGGIKLLGLEKSRYDGELYGGGISYGYQWILGKHWNLEGTIGIGYAHIDYSEYYPERCGYLKQKATHDYWGPTKVGLSFIYILK